MNPAISIFSFFGSFPRRISDLLFGYDVFISYAHRDGSTYAKALAAQLTELCPKVGDGVIRRRVEFV